MLWNIYCKQRFWFLTNFYNQISFYKGSFLLVVINIVRQDSAYLFEVLSWKFIPLQPYVWWIKMKTWKHAAQQNSLAHVLIVTGNKCIVWSYSFSDLTCIYLFECSNINSRIKCKICSKLIIEAPDVVLVSLLLTLNIFGTLS